MAGPKITIDAVEVVHCIRSGMSDHQLMERFGLSSAPLQNLFEQLASAGILKESEIEARASLTPGSVVIDDAHLELPPAPAPAPAAPAAPLPVLKKPVIDALDALKSLRAGMDDTALMKRYNISAKGLSSLFTKLVSQGVIPRDEVDRRAARNAASVVVDDERAETDVIDETTGRVDEDAVVSGIKAGMDFKAVMEAYNISAKRLHELLKKLEATGTFILEEAERKASDVRRYYEIRHRSTDRVIFSGEADSLASLVEMAVRLGVDLADANLARADLSRTDLTGARMARVNLTHATLVGTDLTVANLSEARLSSANLCGAILHKTNLAGAHLMDANMTMAYAVWGFFAKANLSEANLTKANLSGANLANANVFESILTDANLQGAYLTGANIETARREKSRSVFSLFM